MNVRIEEAQVLPCTAGRPSPAPLTVSLSPLRIFNYL